MNTSERRKYRRSDVFIVNFENISYLFLVILLLTLNKKMFSGMQFFKSSSLLLPIFGNGTGYC